MMDDVLSALTQTTENPLVTRFLYVGSALTLLSGLGLLLASKWALAPLALLIVSQLVYFALKRRLYERASSDEERMEATVAPSTRNSFKVSVLVAVVALYAGWSGVLT